SNSAQGSGGGAIAGFGVHGTPAPSTLLNCTVTGNSAGTGGGIHICYVTNCILYFNIATNGPNYYLDPYTDVSYSCTTPLPPNGIGDISDDPLFVNSNAGDFHLQSNSPCINAGINFSNAGDVDLDGSPRVNGPTVDLGAYEYYPTPSLRIVRVGSDIKL